MTTRLPGAAPEQVESEVTDKIEEAVNTISGIDTLTSTSSEGVSQVVVSFLLEKNADVAAQEVRDRVNRILPLLPRTISSRPSRNGIPTPRRSSRSRSPPTAPVRDITEYADKVLRRQLESADGVGQVLVLGGRQRQINVWLDADRLRAHNLTVNDVSRALQAQNVEIPGGRIDQGAQSLTMRTRGRVESPEEFGDIVVREVGGHPVQRARRRADRGRRWPMPQTVASVNGEPDRAAADPQAVGHEHRRGRERREGAARRPAEARFPPATELRIVRDQAEFIEASITQRRGAPRRRLAPRRAGRAAVPRATCARRSSPPSPSPRRSSRRSA